MARVRVKTPEPAANGDAPVMSVRVSGLVLAKDEVVKLLRASVPGLVDVEATEDGRFLLMLGAIEEVRSGDPTAG